MSEFTKVLDRINENLQNEQPMFDGIEFKSISDGWKQAICLDHRTELFRVKPDITGLFTVDILVDLHNKNSRGIGYSSANLFPQDLADSLNEFIESKLDSIREQAVRDFIEYVKGKYPHWDSRGWLTDEMNILYPKKPSDLPSCDSTPFKAPTIPSSAYRHTSTIGTESEFISSGWSHGQLVAAGHGEWVSPPVHFPVAPPAPVYPGSNKPTRRAIQAGDVLFISEDIELTKGLFMALNDTTDKADLELIRNERRFYFQSKKVNGLVAPHSITLEEVFNAPNGLQWPEWATWVEISDKSWRFANSAIAGVNAKLSIPRK